MKDGCAGLCLYKPMTTHCGTSPSPTGQQGLLLQHPAGCFARRSDLSSWHWQTCSGVFVLNIPLSYGLCLYYHCKRGSVLVASDI